MTFPWISFISEVNSSLALTAVHLPLCVTISTTS